jgi:hypothetical protein
MTQPVYTETWANPPEIPATVPAGAPAGTASPGDPETWMMAGGYAALGEADPTATPPRLFRVYDRHTPGEAIRVTDTRADPLWQVIRGDQGTPVADHAAGFQVEPLISAAGLDSRVPGVPSGNGLMLPAVSSSFALPSWGPDLLWRSCWPPPRLNTVGGGGLLVPDGEAVPGSVYEAVAWGQYATGPPPGTTGTPLAFMINWSNALIQDDVTMPSLGNAAVTLTDAVPDTNNTVHARWRIHGLLAITGDGLGYANLTVHLSLTHAFDTNQPPGAPAPFKPPVRYMIGGAGTTPVAPTPIVTTGDRMFAVLVQKPTAGTVTVLGGKTWRAA